MMPWGCVTLDQDPSSQALVEQNFLLDTESSKYLLGLLELNGLTHLNMYLYENPDELVWLGKWLQNSRQKGQTEV